MTMLCSLFKQPANDADPPDGPEVTTRRLISLAASRSLLAYLGEQLVHNTVAHPRRVPLPGRHVSRRASSERLRKRKRNRDIFRLLDEIEVGDASACTEHSLLYHASSIQ
jgi:hypothetical protein